MNQMEIFKNPEFGSVRVIEENGKYLFCGTDVARALGYAIPTKAVNTHCKGVSKMEAPTNLLYAGVDPKTVQYLAGHENSKTTMDIYARVKYNKPEQLVDVVNSAFHQAVPS